jgi:hypothetical protein
MARKTAAQKAAEVETPSAPATGTALRPLAEQGSTEVAAGGGRNAFEDYGNAVSQKSIVGDLLKFSKGDYLAGEDEREVPIGTKIVFNMDQLMVGWIKWEDNKPVQQLMGPIAEGFKPEARRDLGDDDKTLWEEDSNGKQRDPWQFSNYVVCKEVGTNGDTEHLYTFATSSKGGLNAIGEVCKVYGKEMRSRPDEYPIVELGLNSYKHSNPEYGRIKVPVLKVVGWEKKSMFDAPAEDAPAAPKARKKAAR